MPLYLTEEEIKKRKKEQLAAPPTTPKLTEPVVPVVNLPPQLTVPLASASGSIHGGYGGQLVSGYQLGALSPHGEVGATDLELLNPKVASACGVTAFGQKGVASEAAAAQIAANIVASNPTAFGKSGEESVAAAAQIAEIIASKPPTAFGTRGAESVAATAAAQSLANAASPLGTKQATEYLPNKIPDWITNPQPTGEMPKNFVWYDSPQMTDSDVPRHFGKLGTGVAPSPWTKFSSTDRKPGLLPEKLFSHNAQNTAVFPDGTVVRAKDAFDMGEMYQYMAENKEYLPPTAGIQLGLKEPISFEDFKDDVETQKSYDTPERRNYLALDKLSSDLRSYVGDVAKYKQIYVIGDKATKLESYEQFKELAGQTQFGYKEDITDWSIPGHYSERNRQFIEQIKDSLDLQEAERQLAEGGINPRTGKKFTEEDFNKRVNDIIQSRLYYGTPITITEKGALKHIKDAGDLKDLTADELKQVEGQLSELPTPTTAEQQVAFEKITKARGKVGGYTFESIDMGLKKAEEAWLAQLQTRVPDDFKVGITKPSSSGGVSAGSVQDLVSGKSNAKWDLSEDIHNTKYVNPATGALTTEGAAYFNKFGIPPGQTGRDSRFVGFDKYQPGEYISGAQTPSQQLGGAVSTSLTRAQQRPIQAALKGESGGFDFTPNASLRPIILRSKGITAEEDTEEYKRQMNEAVKSGNTWGLTPDDVNVGRKYRPTPQPQTTQYVSPTLSITTSDKWVIRSDGTRISPEGRVYTAGELVNDAVALDNYHKSIVTHVDEVVDWINQNEANATDLLNTLRRTGDTPEARLIVKAAAPNMTPETIDAFMKNFATSEQKIDKAVTTITQKGVFMKPNVGEKLPCLIHPEQKWSEFVSKIQTDVTETDTVRDLVKMFGYSPTKVQEAYLNALKFILNPISPVEGMALLKMLFTVFEEGATSFFRDEPYALYKGPEINLQGIVGTHEEPFNITLKGVIANIPNILTPEMFTAKGIPQLVKTIAGLFVKGGEREVIRSAVKSVAEKAGAANIIDDVVSDAEKLAKNAVKKEIVPDTITTTEKVPYTGKEPVTGKLEQLPDGTWAETKSVTKRIVESGETPPPETLSADELGVVRTTEPKVAEVTKGTEALPSEAQKGLEIPLFDKGTQYKIDKAIKQAQDLINTGWTKEDALTVVIKEANFKETHANMGKAESYVRSQFEIPVVGKTPEIVKPTEIPKVGTEIPKEGIVPTEKVVSPKMTEIDAKLTDVKARLKAHVEKGIFERGAINDPESKQAFNDLVEAAKLYTQKGVLTVEEFAKELGIKVNELVQKAWDDVVHSKVESDELNKTLGLPKESLFVPPQKRVLSQVEMDTTRTEMITRIKASRDVLSERKEAVKALRGKQAGAGTAARTTAGGGEAGFEASRAAMKGEAEKVYTGLGQAEFEQSVRDWVIDSPYRAYQENPAIFHKSGKGNFFTPTNAQEGLIDLMAGNSLPESQVKLLEKVYGIEFIKTIKNTTSGKIQDALGIFKTILSAIDHSFPGRQGWVINSSNPEIAWKSVKNATKSFWSEKYADTLKESVLTHPEFNVAKEAGVSFTDTGLERALREESFPSRFAEHVWGIKQSNRSFTWSANAQRLDAWVKYKSWLGSDPATKDMEKLAGFINVATGRGDLGKLNNIAAELNTVMFSPKLFAARLQLPLQAVTLAKNPRMRAIYWRNVGTSMGVSLTTLGLFAGLAKLPEMKDKLYVETDLRSSDFGKVIIGDTHIDVTGGNSQLVYLMARVFTGERMSGGGVEYDTTAWDELMRYLRYKSAPVMSLGYDVLTGKSVSGKKFGTKDYWTEKIPGSVVPMAIQDMADAYTLSGIGGAAMVAPLTWYGVGANTYEPGATTQEKRLGSLKYTDEQLSAKAQESLDKYVKPGAGDELGQLAVQAKLDAAAAEYYTTVDLKGYLRRSGAKDYKATPIQKYFLESVPTIDKWEKDAAVTKSKQTYTGKEKEILSFWGIVKTGAGNVMAAQQKMAEFKLPKESAPWLYGKTGATPTKPAYR